jgi:dienelactone hydrolase
MTCSRISFATCISLLLLAADFSQVTAAETNAATEWNYDVYRKTYPEQLSSVRSSQSGKSELEPALNFRLSGQPTQANTGMLREQIRIAWRDLIGPSARNTGPLNARVLEEKTFPGYTRKKVQYDADPNEPVRAWLFIPNNVKPGKAPAVLCLHQTVREGKDQAAGLDAKTPELAYGPLLAERGYVTLCPDVICFGERYQVGGNFYCHYGDAVRIYRGNAGRSIMSKMVDDAMRSVDFLSSVSEVDPQRIGSIGHSHGGYGTLFAMAFDERIKAGVVSCGFTCFRSDSAPERWYRRTALIPRLGGFEGKMEQTSVDFHHLFAVIAPRALFLSVALKDQVFPEVGDVKWIEKDLQTVYARDKAKGHYEMYAFDGAHAFTPKAKNRSFSFLDKQLHHQP